MEIDIMGKKLKLDSEKMFIMVLSYLNTKSFLASDKGEPDRAKGYLDQAFEIEEEFKRFKGVDKSASYKNS